MKVELDILIEASVPGYEVSNIYAIILYRLYYNMIIIIIDQVLDIIICFTSIFNIF